MTLIQKIKKSVGKHCTTVVETPEGHIDITYHSTIIARVMPAFGKVVLETGGFETVTTKRRMNQVLSALSPSGEPYGPSWGVFQKNYQWFVSYYQGNGIEI
jgi:hypothetical protein